MVLDKPLDQIEEADLQTLIDDGEREGRRLDYKRELYAGRDQDRIEFLADVTSFANTLGGHIIIGMDEGEGVAVAKEGVSVSDLDTLMLRLQQMLRSGTQPRMSPVAIQPVPLANGNVCLVIRIDRSWARPHAVADRDWLRWYARNSNGKYLLDVQEIRAAFLLSEAISERMRSFRVDRLASINAGDTPISLPVEQRIIYHLLPADAFDLGVLADLTTVAQTTHPANPLFQFAPLKKFNFDGLLFYDDVALNRSGYVQVYDSGIMEAVVARAFPSGDRDQTMIQGLFLENNIIEHVEQLQEGLRRMSVRLPVFLFLSIYGIQGHALFASQAGFESFDPSGIKRDPLPFPEVILDDEKTTPQQLLKPVFDRLWRASGWYGSPSYNSEGEWDQQERQRVFRRLF